MVSAFAVPQSGQVIVEVRIIAGDENSPGGPRRPYFTSAGSRTITSFTLPASCFKLKGLGRK